MSKVVQCAMRDMIEGVIKDYQDSVVKESALKVGARATHLIPPKHTNAAPATPNASNTKDNYPHPKDDY